MTTSGTSDFNLTRNQIIRGALRKLGVIATGETPNQLIITECAEALNAMVKRWDAKGIHIWTESQGIVFNQPNQVQYIFGTGSPDHATESYEFTTLQDQANSGASTITVVDATGIADGYYIGVMTQANNTFWTRVSGTPVNNVITLAAPLDNLCNEGANVYAYQTPLLRPLRVPQARRYVFQSEITTPLIPLSRKDYFDLPNQENTGTVTQWFYDPRGGAVPTGAMYLWPAPLDSFSAVTFTWYRQIQDFDNQSNTPDLPQEWLDTIIFNLAVTLAPEFDCPPQRYAMIKEQALVYMDEVQGWDREPESIYFGVNFEQR